MPSKGSKGPYQSLETAGHGQRLGEIGVQIPPPEPRVTLRVEGKPVDFLVDTGAQNPVFLRLMDL